MIPGTNWMQWEEFRFCCCQVQICSPQGCSRRALKMKATYVSCWPSRPYLFHVLPHFEMEQEEKFFVSLIDGNAIFERATFEIELSWTNYHKQEKKKKCYSSSRFMSLFKDYPVFKTRGEHFVSFWVSKHVLIVTTVSFLKRKVPKHAKVC